MKNRVVNHGSDGMTDESELNNVAGHLRATHDVLPFMTGLHSVSGMELQPMPEEMRALLEASPDYRSIDPGAGPVWLQIASGNEAAELVLYRTRGSGELYVMAPSRDG